MERRVALEDQVDTLFFSRVLGQPNQQLAKISAAILSLESSIRLLKRDLKDARYYRGGTVQRRALFLFAPPWHVFSHPL